MLVHTVLFWLKPGLTDVQRKEFEQRLSKLEAIPSVASFYLGKPARTTDRPVIDRTYDYGITVVLQDVPGHDSYQQDPIHTDFLQHCAPYFERVRVYDME